MSDTRYVYLMETETAGRYKIGFSVDPESRAKQITSNSDQENITQVVMQYRTEFYREFEAMMHARYHKYRAMSNREYFDFDSKMLEIVKSEFSVLAEANDTIGAFCQQLPPTQSQAELIEENERLKYILSEVNDFINQFEPNPHRSLLNSLILIGTRYNRYKGMVETTSEQNHDLRMKIAEIKEDINESIKVSVAVEALVNMKTPPVDSIRTLLYDLVERLHRLEERTDHD